jgi:head-tail adaptor
VSFDSRLGHSLVIERASDGAPDDYNQPTRTWATLATVAGLVQPKTAREVAQLNQAGPSLATFSIYLRPTDVQKNDRIRVADAGVAATYEIDGVLNQAGRNHHLKLDAHVVTA